jgi:hypothetical protein
MRGRSKGLSRVRWKLSRTVLRGGTGGNTGPLLDTGAKGKKQPWHFHLPGDAPFAFAGLWECWRPPEGEPEDVNRVHSER